MNNFSSEVDAFVRRKFKSKQEKKTQEKNGRKLYKFES